MKKSLLIFAGSVACTVLSAQDSIFFWNSFNAHDRMYYGVSNLTLAPNVTPGNSGLGQTWVFTTTSFDFMDTVNVYGINSVPTQYSASYPQSNFAFYYGTNQTSFDFLHHDTSGLYLDGTASLDPNFGVIPQVFSNPLHYMDYPMYFGTTFTDTAFSNWKYPTTGANDSAWEITTVAMTAQVDAQGTLITSYGVYDILRVQRNFEFWQQFATHDSANGWSAFSPLNFTTRMYEFWTDSIFIGWMVASITVNPANDAVMSYSIMTNYVVDVPYYDAGSSFGMYPNPAGEFIVVKGEINSRWEVVDVFGRVVMNGTLRNDTETINVAELAAGMYVLRLHGDNGIRGSRKLLVE